MFLISARVALHLTHSEQKKVVNLGEKMRVWSPRPTWELQETCFYKKKILRICSEHLRHPDITITTTTASVMDTRNTSESIIRNIETCYFQTSTERTRNINDKFRNVRTNLN